MMKKFLSKVFMYGSLALCLPFSGLFAMDSELEEDYQLLEYVNSKGSSHGCEIGKEGKRGPRGHRGYKGDRGRRGHKGDAGRRGAVGPGAIIPFASGEIVELTSINALASSGAIVGFGNANDGISLVSTNIVLGLSTQDFAFTVPRSGNITSFAAHFTSEFGLINEANLTVHAQIYRSTGADIDTNTFVPIASSLIDLFPTIPNMIAPSSKGIVTLNQSVNSEDRLLVVFSITSDNAIVDIPQSLSGFASAGMTIN